MNGLVLAFATLAASASAPSPGPAAEEVAHRAAIVVGAMAPVPGRSLLRHAHRDAETMAEVLSSVGGFERGRVHLLRDPEPAVLLATVEREAAALANVRGAMLFFYYSGHAGDGALYTAGKPVPVEALRRSLDRPDVSIRIGVLDACHGGDWTRAKGLVPDAPFEVTLPPVLAAEGSALIASSSGAESAHESDALGGSFFTHHLAAALRGAADKGRRGEVTLAEAFEYAREQTIRETARVSRETQHPSFALNLRGRQDLVLAQLARSPSTLAVDQAEGPLEIIHLGSGLRMVELPPGSRSVTLSVPPGRYLVRKTTAGGVRAGEIVVPREGAARVGEGDLVLVGSERLAVKGEQEGAQGATPRQWGGDLELGLITAVTECCAPSIERHRLDVGVGDSALQGVRLDGRLALTDRLTWRMGSLAFAYGVGERGGVEVVPYAGLLSWSKDVLSERPWQWRVGAGIGARLPLGGAALVGTVLVERPTGTQRDTSKPDPDYVASAAAGLGTRLGIVSLHLAVGLQTVYYSAFTVDGGGFSFRFPPRRFNSWSLGSIQELGFVQLPLVAFHAPRGFSVNCYGAVVTNLDVPSTSGWVRVGVSKSF